ncbi:bifunctional methylenetetrahydrofolate dehydrogenase/methenyltetrahydrofolate cyclohydrolase FolD [bacterium]|nr:bifunctional methylenetetrahydrofolate dehydrogenase/methenyltetrahydrofolate cyclohydrolase FolD [bacterium]
MMEIIDGKKIASEIKTELKKKISDIKNTLNIAPKLAVILIGDDKASEIYVSKKEQMANELGMESLVCKFDKNVSQEEIEAKIEQLNDDNEVNAILLQLPIPKHLDKNKLIELITPLKDVDGFTPLNAGFLALGEPFVAPCTAIGVIELLNAFNVKPKGKHAVIVGRSNIVGKPLAQLLLNEDATVTVAHSKTENLKEITKTADILVSAVGIKNLITKDMVKDGAVVVDVGITRDENNKIKGDVDFENVSKKASLITPVPGGVGPMTIAMLASNTFNLFCIQNEIEEN